MAVVVVAEAVYSGDVNWRKHVSTCQRTFITIPTDIGIGQPTLCDCLGRAGTIYGLVSRRLSIMDGTPVEEAERNSWTLKEMGMKQFDHKEEKKEQMSYGRNSVHHGQTARGEVVQYLTFTGPGVQSDHARSLEYEAKWCWSMRLEAGCRWGGGDADIGSERAN